MNIEEMVNKLYTLDKMAEEMGVCRGTARQRVVGLARKKGALSNEECEYVTKKGSKCGAKSIFKTDGGPRCYRHWVIEAMNGDHNETV